jgi:hypothetical protein
MGVLQHHLQYLPAAQRLQLATACRLHVPARPGVPQIVPAEVFDADPLERLPSLEKSAYS